MWQSWVSLGFSGRDCTSLANASHLWSLHDISAKFWSNMWHSWMSHDISGHGSTSLADMNHLRLLHGLPAESWSVLWHLRLSRDISGRDCTSLAEASHFWDISDSSVIRKGGDLHFWCIRGHERTFLACEWLSWAFLQILPVRLCIAGIMPIAFVPHSGGWQGW